MKFLSMLLALVFALIVSSCGGSDSADKLMKDQFEYLEEMASVLDDVSEGGSATDAAKKIKALGKKGDEFVERKKKLFDGADPEEILKLTKKYEAKSVAAARELMKSIQKLEKSGRATAELQNAIMNMKSGQ